MRTVSNARLAELAAELAGLTNADGSIRWDELEREFPYLFRPATPPGHAGAGTGAGAPALVSTRGPPPKTVDHVRAFVWPTFRVYGWLRSVECRCIIAVYSQI